MHVVELEKKKSFVRIAEKEKKRSLMKEKEKNKIIFKKK